MNSAAVETAGLCKRYGHVAALDGLTMSVRRGEVFGFLGPNGAGKTTAVKLLLGLARPTSGAGNVLGAPLGDVEMRRKIGYLPELFRYQDWLSAREVLALHLRLLRVPRARWRGAIDDTLELVGLGMRGRDRVGTFSKGMQQRLGLGVALLGDPELVILDEPTSALDPVGRHDVRSIVEGLKARRVTVFLNSHLLTEVERVCDRVIVIDRGRSVAAGTIDEMLGGATSIRLRLGAVDASALALMHDFGAVSCDAPWYAIAGVAEEEVPRLVAGLVATGIQLYELESSRATLEERFLQLVALPQPEESVARDRLAHPA